MTLAQLRGRLGVVFGALVIVACGGSGPSQPAGSETTSAGATSSGATSAGTSAGETGPTSSTGTSAMPTSGGLAPDLPPSCEPTTCAVAGKNCGAIEDGCGEALDCGACVEPETCGGGGVDNVCGQPCVAIRAIFFDLGDTLVVSDGGAQFVERPGANAMIAALKGLGMRVGIITNTPPGFTTQDLQGLLVNPGFLDEFEVVLMSSAAVSPPKPAPAIFVEAHGLLPDAPPIAEVAFVTENLGEIADQEQAPTQGARAAGMVGIHLSGDRPSPLADVTIAPEALEMFVSLAETEWLACEGSP